MSGQGSDNTANYNFSQVDPAMLEAANTLGEHDMSWDQGHCLFCNGPSHGPHAYDCPLHHEHPAQIPNHSYSGVQSYGHAQGMMATPTPVRTANMPAGEVLDAYAPPTQNQQDLMQPTGPVKLNPINFGRQSLDHAASTPTPAPASQPDPEPTLLHITPVSPGQFAYTGHFKSFADAQAALQPQTTDPIVSLNIENDDWRQIKDAAFLHNCGARLLAAIQHMPTEAPAILTDDFSRRYYFDHQENKLTDILKELGADPLKAEARVMICLQEVIDLHEYGVPASVMTRTTHKQGYKIEPNMPCSQRMEKVIQGAMIDKYIAHDILFGLNVKDYVRSPNKFLQRKQENSRVNAKKALDKKTLDHGMGKTDASTHTRKTKVATMKKNSVASKGRGHRQTSLLPDQMPLPAFGSMLTPDSDATTPSTAATPGSNADADFAGQGDMDMQE